MRCPSITFVDHVKTNEHLFEIFSSSGSHTILVFFTLNGVAIFPRESPERVRRMEVGCRQKSRFWSNSGYEDCWTCEVPKTVTDDHAV